jgi:uncharacterized repeat protein (TIGR01451 family)
MRLFYGAVAILILFMHLPTRAESHRATRLGNPATRFAEPLVTAEDMRARFRDPKLRPDFASVLHQWGWRGDVSDLFAAAATNKIEDIKIPIGDVMPFMSSREDGRPICLRNVTWAGKEPAPAYAFNFASKDRLYRCVIPKACSNFFVEDLGSAAKHGLTIDCAAPEKTFAGRDVEVCLTILNTGNVTESQVIVTLPVSADAIVVNATANGRKTNDFVIWEVLDIPAGGSRQVCVTLKTQRPGKLSFSPVAASANVQTAQSSCETMVVGLSALLLETADDPDPVPIGDSTTYTVKVTNQGTADDTNVKIVVEFPGEIEPVSASNEGAVNGKIVTFPAHPRLGPKETFEYKITAKGVKEGDARVKFVRTSDEIPAPTSGEESTRIY